MHAQGQIQRHFTDDDYLSIPIPEGPFPVLEPIAIEKLFEDKLFRIPPMMSPSLGHVMALKNKGTLYLIQHQVISRQSKGLQKVFKKQEINENEEIFDVFVKCLHYDNTTQFITHKNVFHLLVLASKYKANDLRNSCNDFVFKNWQDIDIDNIFLALDPIHEKALIERFFEYIEIESYSHDAILRIKDFASERHLKAIHSFCEYVLHSNEPLKNSLSLRNGTIEITLNKELLKENIAAITDLLTFRATDLSTPILLIISSLPKDPNVLNTIFTKQTNLTGLDLSWNCIGRRIVSFVVTALENLPNLQYLDLSGNAFGNDEVTLLTPSIQTLSKLTYLSLSKNHIRDEGIETLGKALQTLLHLKRLNLSGNRFGNPGIASLVKAFPEDSDLTHLNISNNQITRMGSDSVASVIRKLFHLMSLKLATNGINNEGVKKIAEAIEEHIHLSKIDIGMNEFDFSGNLTLRNIITKFPHMKIKSN